MRNQIDHDVPVLTGIGEAYKGKHFKFMLPEWATEPNGFFQL